MTSIILVSIMFVNRKDELKLLEELYTSRKKEVLILYGRRRTGKTELIKQFIKDNWTKSRFRCSNLGSKRRYIF